MNLHGKFSDGLFFAVRAAQFGLILSLHLRTATNLNKTRDRAHTYTPFVIIILKIKYRIRRSGMKNLDSTFSLLVHLLLKPFKELLKQAKQSFN